MGFDITQIASVVAFVDMQEVAQDLFWKKNRSKNKSLKDMCTFIGFQRLKLHNSGNEAAYTLVVLLSLASKILQNETHGNEAHGNEAHGNLTYAILEEIAKAALMSAKIVKQPRKEMEQEQVVKDWAKNLDSKNF